MAGAHAQQLPVGMAQLQLAAGGQGLHQGIPAAAMNPLNGAIPRLKYF